MPRKKAFPKEDTIRVHLVLPKRLYREVWKIAAEKFDKPVGNVSKVIAEALDEYVKRHRGGRI